MVHEFLLQCNPTASLVYPVSHVRHSINSFFLKIDYELAAVIVQVAQWRGHAIHLDNAVLA